MTPHDAAKILDLPVDATPEQIETRFNELRAKLEDKVAKAPTPGLKAKYRESLEEITAAFETLTLAADASALPVLQRQKNEAGGPVAAKPAAAEGAPPAPRETPAKPAAAKKSGGGREFLIVVVLAVAVLGAGGWWVMKTRAENEEKARLAAEQKAEAEHQAQVAKEKAEQERLAKEAADKAARERSEKLFTSLRSRMAELNVAYDALMRTEQTAERELGELKSQERDLAREQKAAPTPELRRLSAQVRAQDRLVSWLRDTLPTHPAKVARAKADELLSARATDEAVPAVADYAREIDQLKKDIAESRTNLAVTATLQLSANLEGATWQLTDAFGIERSGSAPAQLDDVALGKGMLTFRRAGWPDQRYSVDLRPGGGTATGKFPIGSLRVTSEPAGAQVYRGDAVIGTTPLDIPQLPPSQLELRVGQRGFRSQKISGMIEDGKTLTLQATLQPGKMVDTEFLLDSLVTELAAIGDPKSRASFAMSVLTIVRQLDGIPKPALRRLMDVHLAACQAIPEAKARFDALNYPSKVILPSIDFDYSRAWGELALATLPQITVATDRQQALFMVDTYMVHPDLEARMAAAMTNWFQASDDWTYRGMVAQRFAEAGAEAEAQRAVTRAMDPSNEYQNKLVQDYVVTGRQIRQFVPVKVALLKGDVAGAKRELARHTGKVEYGELFYFAGEFIRLGDPESALRMARLTQTEFVTSALTSSALVNAAITAGNYPLAEQWAAGLADTKDAPTRSQAYLVLARTYLANGRTAEALQAVNKVVNFPTTAYAGDRYESALILAQLGEADRARKLIQSAPLAFTKEESVKLWYAAALFVLLDQPAAAERALNVIRTDSADYVDAALNMIVQALAQTGRFDDAKVYQARVSVSVYGSNAYYAIAPALVRRTPEDDLGYLVEQTPAGKARSAILYSILARNLDRQNSARYSTPR